MFKIIIQENGMGSVNSNWDYKDENHENPVQPIQMYEGKMLHTSQPDEEKQSSIIFIFFPIR